jgi:hypothetical protein
LSGVEPKAIPRQSLSQIRKRKAATFLQIEFTFL